jgi:phage tail tape-measure protein
MAPKVLSAVLIGALAFALCTPVEAQSSGKIVSNGTIAGAIVGIAAGVAVIAIVAIHYSKKRSITGCVNSRANGMTLADEKDKQSYVLSGDTTNIKPGDRIRLQGKKAKSKGSDQTLVWETRKLTKDFGVCQP